MQTIIDELKRQIAVRELELRAVETALTKLRQMFALAETLWNEPDDGGDAFLTEPLVPEAEPPAPAVPAAAAAPLGSRLDLRGVSSRKCCEMILAEAEGWCDLYNLAKIAVKRGYRSQRKQQPGTDRGKKAIAAFRWVLNHHSDRFERHTNNKNMYRLRD